MHLMPGLKSSLTPFRPLPLPPHLKDQLQQQQQQPQEEDLSEEQDELPQQFLVQTDKDGNETLVQVQVAEERLESSQVQLVEKVDGVVEHGEGEAQPETTVIAVASF